MHAPTPLRGCGVCPTAHLLCCLPFLQVFLASSNHADGIAPRSAHPATQPSPLPAQVFYAWSSTADCILEVECTGRWRQAFDQLRALGGSRMHRYTGQCCPMLPAMVLCARPRAPGRHREGAALCVATSLLCSRVSVPPTVPINASTLPSYRRRRRHGARAASPPVLLHGGAVAGGAGASAGSPHWGIPLAVSRRPPPAPPAPPPPPPPPAAPAVRLQSAGHAAAAAGQDGCVAWRGGGGLQRPPRRGGTSGLHSVQSREGGADEWQENSRGQPSFSKINLYVPLPAPLSTACPAVKIIDLDALTMRDVSSAAFKW